MIIPVKFAITTSAGGAYDSSALPLTCQGAEIMTNLKGPLLLEAVEVAIGTLTSGAVDITLSTYNTQSGISRVLLTLTDLAANAWYYPRALGSDAVGAALTGWYVQQVVEGTLKIVVAQGGNVQTGSVIVYVRVP